MSAQITVTLPEDVMRRAELLARRTGRPVAEVLAQTIEISLSPLGSSATKSLSELSNEEVLAACDVSLSAADDQRLSDLLDRQQAGLLGPPERLDLTALMQVYQEGLLRKAEALREAARRGLRGPLAP